MEKVTLWKGPLSLISESETNEGVDKDKISAQTANQAVDCGLMVQYAIH